MSVMWEYFTVSEKDQHMHFVRHVPVTFQEEEASVLPAMFVAFCRDSGGVTMNLRGSYPPPSLVPFARMVI